MVGNGGFVWWLEREVRAEQSRSLSSVDSVTSAENDVPASSLPDYLVAALDPAVGDAIRSRSLDSTSVGVKAQAALRVGSDEDGYAEPNLWTGIGRARSGCGAAIVGSPRQVADKIESYRDLGIDTFILSGYPHLDECRRFAELVLPLLRA